MSLGDFKDQIHVEKIRERLWSGREVGQAAVMVGAGFSLNARPVSPAATRFLLWTEIGHRLYDELYQSTETAGEAAVNSRIQRTTGLEILRLAEEYKAAFGRERLD